MSIYSSYNKGNKKRVMRINSLYDKQFLALLHFSNRMCCREVWSVRHVAIPYKKQLPTDGEFQELALFMRPAKIIHEFTTCTVLCVNANISVYKRSIDLFWVLNSNNLLIAPFLIRTVMSLFQYLKMASSVSFFKHPRSYLNWTASECKLFELNTCSVIIWRAATVYVSHVELVNSWHYRGAVNESRRGPNNW